MCRGGNRVSPRPSPPSATHSLSETGIGFVVRADGRSRAVVGKSRTTGSNYLTSVSSTIAKHHRRAAGGRRVFDRLQDNTAGAATLRDDSSVSSHIGTTHNCSKYIYRSKNVLVPKRAKKRSGWSLRMRAAVVVETHPEGEREREKEMCAPLRHIPPHPARQHRRGTASGGSSRGSFSALFMALW